MSFLHPHLLWLAPLIALPIVIHLLNRIRYRRVRWAAIDFLLAVERRAVRRARLKQLLLMALRMLVLAAALGALVQPVVRGGLAALLGGSRQAAILLDASASMSAAGAGGSAFERGKALVVRTLEALPRGARVAGGAFTHDWHSAFREPLQDRSAVAAALEEARLTGARGDVPRALRAAAECLARGGGGGTIWLLTDLQASGWRADNVGEWQLVRQALLAAARPQVVITDLGPGVESNLCVSALALAPAVPIGGDAPKLTATVELRASRPMGATASVALYLDGRRIDSRTHEFAEPGKTDVVFHLPPLKGGAHAGWLELGPDAMPGDDRYSFVISASARWPILVADGAASSIPFESAGDFVRLALQPPESRLAERSPFAVESIAAQELAVADLSRFAAIVLADVPRLAPEALGRVQSYLHAGGLVLVFPGPHTDAATWSEARLGGVRIGPLIEVEGEKRLRLGAVAPTHPVVATLPAEGLDRVLVAKLFRLSAEGQAADTLIHTERGEPFLVRTQVGAGKAYFFAVSAQADFSNLPFTPPFLLTLHRAVQTHLVEAAAPLSLPTLAELEVPLPPGAHVVLLPDGRAAPLMRGADGRTRFGQTEQAGIYRLAAGAAAPPEPEAAAPIAALNVPAQESTLERLDAATIQGLLPDTAVSWFRPDGGGVEGLGPGSAERSAASTFPLAALAFAFLLGEVILAWSLGRPSKETGRDA